MLKDIDTFKLSYYNYGEPMYGCIGGMNFKIEKGKAQGDEETPVLDVYVWKGPYSFEHTKETKTRRSFAYTEEGKSETTVWLNETYEADRSFWDEGLIIR